MLRSRGFGEKWIGWVCSCLYQGTFAVKINDTIGPHFVGGKGLKQGDPSSPLLFNLVADVFSKMLKKATSHNLIKGLLPHVVPGGVVNLQYADDTLLFLDAFVDHAKHLEWILVCFEKQSGLCINFHKSDLHTINIDEETAKEFAQIFCCQIGDFPFKYLGVPLHFKKLRREDLQPIIDKIIKNISSWLWRFLSYRGKLILLTTFIASIPSYLMSIVKFPKWAIDMITSQMSHFFWGNVGDNHKYHLASWGPISRKSLVVWGFLILEISTWPFWLLGGEDFLMIELVIGKRFWLTNIMLIIPTSLVLELRWDPPL